MKNIEIIGRKTEAMNIRDILKKAETTEDREEYNRTHSRLSNLMTLVLLLKVGVSPKKKLKRRLTKHDLLRP